MKRIIIQGSSRSKGNTNDIVQLLQKELSADFLDLREFDIRQFDYEYTNRDDDFLAVMKKLLEYDMLIFATPVYWYSMSGTMKKFFDRITDCLKIYKELGEKLKGKYLAAISCGPDDDVPASFFVPFCLSAEYLDMKYAGGVHTWVGDGVGVSEEVKGIVKDFAFSLR